MQSCRSAVQVDVLPDEAAIDARVFEGILRPALHFLTLEVDDEDYRYRRDQREVGVAIVHAAGQSAQVGVAHTDEGVGLGIPEVCAIGAADIYVDLLAIHCRRSGALAQVRTVDAVGGPEEVGELLVGQRLRGEVAVRGAFGESLAKRHCGTGRRRQGYAGAGGGLCSEVFATLPGGNGQGGADIGYGGLRRVCGAGHRIDARGGRHLDGKAIPGPPQSGIGETQEEAGSLFVRQLGRDTDDMAVLHLDLHWHWAAKALHARKEAGGVDNGCVDTRRRGG